MKSTAPARTSGTCYYCGAPATSMEHVPPKCMFPESKDSLGVDLRSNLITVPSCQTHNLEKSKDDEFLMATVTPVVGNNVVGYRQTHTKLKRAVTRGRGRLFRAAMSNARPAILRTRDGADHPVLIGDMDIPRLLSVLEHVARGLYFNSRGERFCGTCSIMPGFVRFDDDPVLEKVKRLCALLIGHDRHGWPTAGDNHEVFHYEIGPMDRFGMTPMVMTFFGNADVYVAFKPDGVVLPSRTLDSATPASPICIDIEITEGDA